MINGFWRKVDVVDVRSARFFHYFVIIGFLFGNQRRKRLCRCLKSFVFVAAYEHIFKEKIKQDSQNKRTRSLVSIFCPTSSRPRTPSIGLLNGVHPVIPGWVGPKARFYYQWPPFGSHARFPVPKPRPDARRGEASRRSEMEDPDRIGDSTTAGI